MTATFIKKENNIVEFSMSADQQALFTELLEKYRSRSTASQIEREAVILKDLREKHKNRGNCKTQKVLQFRP